jgi:hypothetical protein
MKMDPANMLTIMKRHREWLRSLSLLVRKTGNPTIAMPSGVYHLLNLGKDKPPFPAALSCHSPPW